MHFHPLPAVAHHGGMQGFVAVVLGAGNPVAQTRGVGTIEACNKRIDFIAVVFFFVERRIQHNANGKQVVHFFKRYAFFLHLAPNGANGLDPSRDGELQIRFVQLFANRGHKLVDELGTFGLGFFDFAGNAGIDFGLGIFQRQVFQLALYRIQAQAVRQRHVNIDGFGRDFELLVFGHGIQGAHIVQAVGQLDENHAHIVRKGKKNFFEVLGLQRSRLVLVKDDVYFGEPVHNTRHRSTKARFDVGEGVFGVFHHIVQKGAHHRRWPQADVGHHNVGHLQGMKDIGFARLAAGVGMGRHGQVERILNVGAFLLADVALKIAKYRLVHLPYLLLLTRFVYFIHAHWVFSLYFCLRLNTTRLAASTHLPDAAFVPANIFRTSSILLRAFAYILRR